MLYSHIIYIRFKINCFDHISIKTQVYKINCLSLRFVTANVWAIGGYIYISSSIYTDANYTRGFDYLFIQAGVLKKESSLLQSL